MRGFAIQLQTRNTEAIGIDDGEPPILATDVTVRSDCSSAFRSRFRVRIETGLGKECQTAEPNSSCCHITHQARPS